MPVTARLSKTFYERLGDQATNELVNWLNDMSTEFRRDLDQSEDKTREFFRSALENTEARLRSEMMGLETRLKDTFHGELRSQLRWTIMLWVTTLLTMIGLKFF